jgi:hypothetical protein
MIEHHPSNGWLFVLAATLVVLAAVIGWWIRTERQRTGSMLPWLLLGGAFSTVLVATTSAVLGIDYGSGLRFSVVVLGTELPLALILVNGLVMGALPFVIARSLASASSPHRFVGLAAALSAGAVVAAVAGRWTGLLTFSSLESYRSAGQAAAGIAIQVLCVFGCATVVFLIKPVIRAARVVLVAIPVVVTGAITGLLCPLVAVAVHDHWSPAALGVAAMAISAIAVVLIAAMGRVVTAAPRLLPAIKYWGPTTTAYHSRRAAPVRFDRTV